MYSGTASSTSVVSGRISYVFGYTGVCATVDTACSSSLVCLSFCEKGLRSRSAPEGLVCSANLIVTPEVSLMYSTANMLTADGRCKALDASADGYVRSEACSVARLVLLDLSADSLDGYGRAGGAVCAVAAVAVNQDGRSSSLTAPNGVAQQGLILQVRHTARNTARLETTASADAASVQSHFRLTDTLFFSETVCWITPGTCARGP